MPKDYVDVVGMPERFEARPVGVIRSPYRERYGTPRQATVVQGVKGEAALEARVELFTDVVPAEAVRDLEGFERIWLVTWLHLTTSWRPTVVPTRGPKVRRGVFATRSPNRPNPIGLTATELLRVEGHVLHVRGLDLLDGTPVIDIKPYVPYADAFPSSRAGWVDALDEPPDAPDRPTRPPR